MTPMMNTPSHVIRTTAVMGMALSLAAMPIAHAQDTQPASAVAAESVAAAEAEKGQAYVIHGDFSEAFVSGEVLIYTYAPKAKSGGGMMAASSMTTMGASTSAKSSGPERQIEARVELVDGKFRVEGEVSRIHAVYFHVENGINHEGRRMGPVKGQQFVLEPGELTMTMDAHHQWVMRGKYNDIVFNSWKESDAYLTPKTQLYTLPPAGSDEAAIAARNKKIAELQSAFLEAEFAARRTIAMTHPDLLARELAITTGFVRFGWEIDAARAMLREDPGNAWAKDFIVQWEARKAKLDREGAGVGVGDYAVFFDAETLAGETVSLRDACGDNRYVLLEFWASWCGPCRAEIPNMKKAYTQYNEAGFEIFSFTIDKDKDAWAKASKDEELPWIDSGYGQESKPKKLYRVTGVPNNYLIDCETGKVIAKNLRGEALGEKLEELFGAS